MVKIKTIGSMRKDFGAKINKKLVTSEAKRK